ncbi:MAG TPA: hypothetical protein VHP33_02140 [Polyangiaceae bacterium]|nr:hypothetical protein [Polyangiaceae bacterium]
MSGILKKGSSGELTDMISMRLSPEDRQLLETVGGLVPVVPKLTLARIALRIGLEVIRKNPAQALATPSRRQAR